MAPPVRPSYESDDKSEFARGPRPDRVSPLLEGNDNDSGPNPTIELLLREHREELLKLRELIAMLGDRIITVLGPEYPPEGKPSGGMSERSPLASTIEELSLLARNCAQEVYSITHRVEL